MKYCIRKTVSSFLAIFIIFGLFVITDDSAYLAAETALQNTSYMSSETFKKGDTISITCRATGSTGFYQYAAYYKKTTDEKWTTLQKYGANVNLNFTPAEVVDYDVCIKVKDNKGAESKKYFVLKANNNLVNNSVISKTSIKLGESITATGSATGGTGSYQYQILYKRTSQTKWTVAQNYNANAVVSFKPTASTTYDVCVKVKDGSGTEVKKFFTVQVTSALQNTSKVSSQSIKLGETVTITAAATGGTGKYTYAVYYKKDYDKKWTTKQDYKNNNTVSVKPANQALYNICVKVKDSDGTIVKKYFDVTVSDSLKNTSTISSDTINLGETVTISCSAKGGSGFYQYAVYYKKETESKWTTKQNYNSNISISIKPANATKYDVCVKVKDDTGTVEKKYFKVSVTSGTNTNKTKYNITYYISNNDNYLSNQNIENKNPNIYYSEDGLELKDLIVPGYKFKGWFTAQTGGTQVTQFAKGTTGDKVLYAHWEKVEYTIIFDSPDVPVASVKYTVDNGITLTNPSWFGYTFVGWSKDGELISSIPPGTTGNITLHANWTSNRNKARAVSKLDTPNIIEDMDNGQYMFIYEIGTIENVPLSQIEYIGNSEGININKEYEYSTSVNERYAENIAKSISNATTKSSSWTLSEDWNKTTSATNEHDEEHGKTQQKVDSNGNVIGSKYYISNSSGGSTAVSSSGGGSNSSSSKVTTGQSTGINGSYTNEQENGSSVNLHADVALSAGMKAGAEVNSGVAKANAETSISAEISAGVAAENTKKDKATATTANSRTDNIGTDDTTNEESHWDSSSSSSSSWNSENGYENSSSVSHNTELSNTISQIIYDRYSYTSMESRGASNSETKSTGETQELKNEYNSTIEYSTEKKESIKRYITYSSSATGYYRLVTAGTVHVFAVVGYDIATNSYFTYTYNVLDKERHEYLDYSKNNANFNDCENAVLPFEVPYFVNEYISVVIGRSSGLTVDIDNGFITEFGGNAEYVVIPEYVSVKNNNNTYSAIRIRGFDSDTFKGNTKIKGVYLPKYIYNIPNNAFDGCTSLEVIQGYGITEIGNNAFRNCTSLSNFYIDKKVTNLGTNAFENVNEINVNAYNSNIAEATVNSNAKKITLNIANISNDFDNKTITIGQTTDYFALISNNNTYNNLRIDSKAEETLISNIVFANNTGTPLKINSAVVTLSKIDIKNNSGFALILLNDNTKINLFGTINLNSLGENTIISKNVSLYKADPEVAGKLKVGGKYLICGEVTNSKMLDISGGQLVNITSEQFESMLSSSTVSFNANGGTLNEQNKLVYYGQAYGTLPTPSRSNYNFDGWFTATTEGTKITSESIVTASSNHTLYAHWSPKQYTVYFNGNGGTVSSGSKKVTYNGTYGNLPTAQRDYYDFTGWYTSDGTRIYDSTVFTGSSDITLYAHWSGHVPSGWTLSSNVPSGAKIEERKWTYTQREYTESGSSSLGGWTKYDTRRTGWGGTQGPVYYDPSNGERNVWSEYYVISSNYKTVYHYYRYAESYTGGKGSYTNYYSNYYQYDFDWELEETSAINGHRRFMYWYCDTNWTGVYMCDPFTTQEWVSDNYGTRWYFQDPIYTYYYYRDVNKESGSNPSGSNISNVQEWVRYIPK